MRTVPAAISPPGKTFKRHRRWETFAKLFQPELGKQLDGYVDTDDVPAGADAHSWWTIIDPCDGAEMYLVPGFHFANRFGLVHCAVPWAGSSEDHPTYAWSVKVKPVIGCVVTVELANDRGRPPTSSDVALAQETLENAIQNRLFGQGFLPDDLVAEAWDIRAFKQPTAHTS